jgi:hypothetical protein
LAEGRSKIKVKKNTLADNAIALLVAKQNPDMFVNVSYIDKRFMEA